MLHSIRLQSNAELGIVGKCTYGSNVDDTVFYRLFLSSIYPLYYLGICQVPATFELWLVRHKPCQLVVTTRIELDALL